MSGQGRQNPQGGASERGAGAVKSASRTLDVLELLSSAPDPRTLAEMAVLLEVPKSSLHGILRTMQARGWVEADGTGTRYRLGVRALLTGTAYVDGDDIVAITAAILDRLSEETGETVHLGRLDGPDVVYLAKRESTHAVRLYSAVGRRLPAHATALGKALLAAHDPGEVDRRLNWPLASLTPTTITDPAELHAELERVRARGYAADEGENTPDIRCVAVALAQPAAGVNALSCSVPRTRASDERMAELAGALRRAARDIDPLAQRLRTT
ncbi:IclR family transcriptional regulator [Actinomadura parmotrematis]|uniref:IclR family transcriptional regulator n=1 Tax=Actinomadura parmotrematis TaxID=2864039 RepID=A0ABS7G4E7_9ACTN|nr:IclR family transcriptional regulator [Actinomadura parmotrematis]MBW8486729.1 IclR family transcriptional regulator [Actinomadura parmotrematis]